MQDIVLSKHQKCNLYSLSLNNGHADDNLSDLFGKEYSRDNLGNFSLTLNPSPQLYCAICQA